MTETELRLNASLTAAKWLGTKEGSADHRKLLDAYNAIRPLPRNYVMTGSDPWCAAFVSAVAVDGGVGDLFPLECSCGRIVSKAQKMGIWVEDDAHIPGIGDWVLYNWNAEQTGDDTGAPDHIGIVICIREREIMVVEGNYDNAVKLRSIPFNDRRIRGFVCPRYDSLAKEDIMECYHKLEDVPAYARETIRKLTEDGSLRGITEDDLGLSGELIRILVILDRRGVL